jgi:hypothetical protein
MSISTYQNQVSKYQKEIADLRKKLSTEIDKRSKIIKKINYLTKSINSTKSLSTANFKINELSRRKKEYSTIEKKISDIETKIAQKNKDLNRSSNNLEREKKRGFDKEQRENKERLNTVKAINAELQKKTLLEKKLDINSTDIEEEIFVVKADIKNFSQFMQNEFLSIYIPENFDVIVKKHCLDCFYYKVSNGDSLFVLESDFKKLLKAIKRIIEDLGELQGNPRIRFAIDYGQITYSVNDGYVTKIKNGSPLRLSARLEPLVTPNEIWVTENVFKQLEDEHFSFIDLAENGCDLESINGEFNIKKDGSPEDDIFTRVTKIADLDEDVGFPLNRAEAIGNGTSYYRAAEFYKRFSDPEVASNARQALLDEVNSLVSGYADYGTEFTSAGTDYYTISGIVGVDTNDNFTNVETPFSNMPIRAVEYDVNGTFVTADYYNIYNSNFYYRAFFIKIWK